MTGKFPLSVFEVSDEFQVHSHTLYREIFIIMHHTTKLKTYTILFLTDMDYGGNQLLFCRANYANSVQTVSTGFANCRIEKIVLVEFEHPHNSHINCGSVIMILD